MRFHPFLVGTLMMGLAPSAFAQHATVAEALFRDARQAMKSGDYERACPALAESHRLDPVPGTLINLAICEEKVGRLATAWTRYREFVDAVPETDNRRSVASDRLLAIEKRLPRLRISIAGGEDAVVALDGVELRAASLGVDVPVDPGEHRLVLSLQSGASSERSVHVSPGERIEVELSPPESKPPGPVPSPKPTPARELLRPVETALVHPPPSSPPPPRRDHSLATAGYVTGAVGIAGLTTAAVFTGMALHQKGIVNDYCNATTCTDQRGADAAEDGARFLRMADVALVVGVVGVATGAFLLWRSARTQVGIRGGPSTAAVSLTTVLP